jgi:hypothetical protein
VIRREPTCWQCKQVLRTRRVTACVLVCYMKYQNCSSNRDCVICTRSTDIRMNLCWSLIVHVLSIEQEMNENRKFLWIRHARLWIETIGAYIVAESSWRLKEHCLRQGSNLRDCHWALCVYCCRQPLSTEKVNLVTVHLTYVRVNEIVNVSFSEMNWIVHPLHSYCPSFIQSSKSLY